ncbi:MAG: hypothetical protein ABSF49_06460 [Roseiarcus sp.]|uniref:hypothetical protein n=1 Tax=Roseiarcus sp. TaxID=1969460 RepID=UPI003C19A76E
MQTYLVQAATAFFGLVIMAQVANAQELVVRLAFDQVFDRILPFPELDFAPFRAPVSDDGPKDRRFRDDAHGLFDR